MRPEKHAYLTQFASLLEDAFMRLEYIDREAADDDLRELIDSKEYVQALDRLVEISAERSVADKEIIALIAKARSHKVTWNDEWNNG